MIPRAFDYHPPASVADAVRLLGELGADARLLAGGHSLMPMMKLRFAQPEPPDRPGQDRRAAGIAEEGDEIHIGAMTTEHELIVASALLAEKLPICCEARAADRRPAGALQGTIGGDIAHGDPGNDIPR